MDYRITYLRDLKGNPVACVAIRLHKSVGMEATDYITYQLSVLNPADRFNRAVARQLAIGREVEAPLTAVVKSNASKHEITQAVFSDIVADRTIPTRARKSAKLWLHWNGCCNKEIARYQQGFYSGEF